MGQKCSLGHNLLRDATPTWRDLRQTAATDSSHQTLIGSVPRSTAMPRSRRQEIRTCGAQRSHGHGKAWTLDRLISSRRTVSHGRMSASGGIASDLQSQRSRALAPTTSTYSISGIRRLGIAIRRMTRDSEGSMREAMLLAAARSRIVDPRASVLARASRRKARRRARAGSP